MRRIDPEPPKPAASRPVGWSLVLAGLVGGALWWAVVPACACSSAPETDSVGFRSEYLESGRLVTAQVAGGRLFTTVSAEVGEAPLVVLLDGAPLQRLVRDIGDSGATLIHRGDGTLRLEANGAFSMENAVGLRMVGPAGWFVCDPCQADEVRELPAGFYALETTEPGWSVADIVVRDALGVYATERVPAGERIYLPPEAQLALTVRLAPAGG